VPELKRSVLSVSEFVKKCYQLLFRYGKVLFVPKGSSFISAMVLGVRECNLYRLRGQHMCVVATSSRETVEEEQLAPLVAQVQKEQIAPLVAQV
jgi:hypothetical protein